MIVKVTTFDLSGENLLFINFFIPLYVMVLPIFYILKHESPMGIYTNVTVLVTNQKSCYTLFMAPTKDAKLFIPHTHIRKKKIQLR